MRKFSYVAPLYKTVIKYILIFCSFVFLNFSTPFSVPFSLSGFNAFCMSGLSPIILSLLCILSIFLMGKPALILPTSVALIIMSIIFYLYKLKNSKPNYEFIIYILASLIYYTFSNIDNFYVLAIYSVFITLLTFLMIGAVGFFILKGIKYEPTAEEIVIIFSVLCVLILGMINTISFLPVKTIAIFSILFLSKTASKSSVLTVALLFGIPVSIYFSDIAYTAVFIILAFLSLLAMPLSPFFAGLMILLFDYLFYAIFSVYNSYSIISFSLSVASVILFFVLPNRVFLLTQEVLSSKKSRTLVKKALNKTVEIIKEKLFDISEVFFEISASFDEFKKQGLTEDDATNIIVNETYKSCCFGCVNNSRCKTLKKNFSSEIIEDLTSIIKIGMAKGKISFIDLPKDLSACCVNPNSLMFSINKQLSEYRNMLIDNQNFDLSRELIAKQAEGVGELLQKMAHETTKDISLKSGVEEKISSLLRRKGFSPLECLIFGENDNYSVSIIIKNGEYDPRRLEKTVSKVLNYPLRIFETAKIEEDKIFMTLKKPFPYRVAVGVSSKAKKEDEGSGDTHSQIQIENGKCIFAVSDGMGSGEKARRISDVTLSLIESFYKAGLKSEAVLPLVNKLLAINTDESFSALDIAIIDLNNLSTDFIKFGAPRGYLINSEGIKIIEGNALPIGIIKELEPTIIKTNLTDGDMLILVSDGVADAFSTTSEILNYFKNLPALNPKSVSENILNKAISLSKNQNSDDMTVLCVRIFKNDDYALLA